MLAKPELGLQALLMWTRASWFASGVAVLVSLGGCGGSDPQESPASVVIALHERVADGEFEQACELFTQEVLDAISQGGSDCQTALATQYPADRREEIHDADVDDDMIEVNGDTAIVPASAVVFDGEPSTGSDTQGCPTRRQVGDLGGSLTLEPAYRCRPAVRGRSSLGCDGSGGVRPCTTVRSSARARPARCRISSAAAAAGEAPWPKRGRAVAVFRAATAAE